MDKEFVPYAESLELKELGLDKPCFGFWNHNDSKMYYWNDEEFQNERTNTWFLDTEKKFPKISKNGCTAPTFSQAFRWFREKYNLIGLVEGGYDNGKNIFTYIIWNGFRDNIFDNYYSTYEDAELECLRKLIEIIKSIGEIQEINKFQK